MEKIEILEDSKCLREEDEFHTYDEFLNQHVLDVR